MISDETNITRESTVTELSLEFSFQSENHPWLPESDKERSTLRGLVGAWELAWINLTLYGRAHGGRLCRSVGFNTHATSESWGPLTAVMPAGGPHSFYQR